MRLESAAVLFERGGGLALRRLLFTTVRYASLFELDRK